ncbi:MAG: pyruvate kinase [Gemmatimonadota bacterium]
MSDHRPFRRARILCTIGPASRDPEILDRMIEAGMDGVRINFSHSSHGEAADAVRMTREAAARAGRPLAVLADLQGPKLRVGELPAALPIEPGGEYMLVAESGAAAVADAEPGVPVIPTSWEAIGRDLRVGDPVLLDDGGLAFEVVEVVDGRVRLVAANDGLLTSHKGMNLPGTVVSAPSLTPKDKTDLEQALEMGADYVALSFIRQARDMIELRDLVGNRALLIAKIEKEQALEQLGEIIRISDGVMVARGDLGVELDFEEVPIVQKRVLRLTREMAKLGITATQMLESMISSPRPTRAEVSDVANALVDGTDVVMLSAETAAGMYPVESVGTMDRVIRRIERERQLGDPGLDPHRTVLSQVHHTVAGAIAGAAAEATGRLGAPFVVTLTRSGFTAWVVSAQRLRVPILAVTDQSCTCNQMALAWGVIPLLVSSGLDYDEMVAEARRYALEAHLGQPGDPFVVTAGFPFHVPGTTNYMRVETLAETDI